MQENDETVQILEQESSAPERVAAAVECLPPYITAKTDDGEFQFQYATIRDYAHAYASGRVTPTQVPLPYSLLNTNTVSLEPLL